MAGWLSAIGGILGSSGSSGGGGGSGMFSESEGDSSAYSRSATDVTHGDWDINFGGEKTNWLIIVAVIAVIYLFVVKGKGK